MSISWFIENRLNHLIFIISLQFYSPGTPGRRRSEELPPGEPSQAREEQQFGHERPGSMRTGYSQRLQIHGDQEIYSQASYNNSHIPSFHASESIDHIEHNLAVYSFYERPT